MSARANFTAPRVHPKRPRNKSPVTRLHSGSQHERGPTVTDACTAMGMWSGVMSLDHSHTKRSSRLDRINVHTRARCDASSASSGVGYGIMRIIAFACVAVVRVRGGVFQLVCSTGSGHMMRRSHPVRGATSSWVGGGPATAPPPLDDARAVAVAVSQAPQCRVWRHRGGIHPLAWTTELHAPGC